jgi:hypothetical protein
VREPIWRRHLRFWGPDVDADVDDELRFHLEMRQRDYETRGLSPAEASRAARERFGDPARVQQVLRSHDRGRERRRHRRERMHDFVQDVRFGLRSFRRAPGFTLVAVLTLALGIGATTAIFSVVHAVLLRPLPYRDAERVVMVWLDNRPQNVAEDIHSWPNFADLRAQSRAFARLAAYRRGGYNLTGACAEGVCEPQRVNAAVSTAGPVRRARRRARGRPHLRGRRGGAGRGRRRGDQPRPVDAPVRRRPARVGRTVRLNGRERTVIGVMPRGFAFPAADTDVWVPLALSPEARARRNSFSLYVVGRLAPNVSLAGARADAGTVWRRLQQQYPDALREYGLNVVPLPDQVVGRALRTALWVMLGAVGAVLLIGCANVANLMLSRAAAREREVSVRVALGAGRRRLVQQLLTESVLLAALGGALGVALAWAGLRVLTRLAPPDIPRLDEVGIDGAVLAAALGVIAAAGVAFGLVPALQASRPDLAARCARAAAAAPRAAGQPHAAAARRGAGGARRRAPHDRRPAHAQLRPPAAGRARLPPRPPPDHARHAAGGQVPRRRPGGPPSTSGCSSACGGCRRAGRRGHVVDLPRPDAQLHVVHVEGRVRTQAEAPSRRPSTWSRPTTSGSSG